MVWVIWLSFQRAKEQAQPIRFKNFRIGESLQIKSNWMTDSNLNRISKLDRSLEKQSEIPTEANDCRWNSIQWIILTNTSMEATLLSWMYSTARCCNSTSALRRWFSARSIYQHKSTTWFHFICSKQSLAIRTMQNSQCCYSCHYTDFNHYATIYHPSVIQFLQSIADHQIYNISKSKQTTGQCLPVVREYIDSE